MSSSVMNSAVIVMLAAACFVAVSGKHGDPKFCGCGPAKDPKNFPARLRHVLDDVVKTTASQPKNVVSGDVTYTSIDPKNGRRGGAVAAGTCFRGVGLAGCSACLSNAREELERCGAFACGGLRFEGKCRFQFRQIK
ncbi:unnamed protein product [Linum trigynum]